VKDNDKLNRRFWYLIYSKPRQERLAQEQLNRQGYETYLPVIRSRHHRQGRYEISVEPLFSRYLFIRLNKLTDNWGPIRSTVGVSTIVRFGIHPTAVPDELVKYIQSNDDDKGIQNTIVHKICRGNKVRIVEGLMSGYNGIYIGRSGKERAIVLLELIGNFTRIEIPEGKLELTCMQ
jgi:transcriptional antiterminator RfaH